MVEGITEAEVSQYYDVVVVGGTPGGITAAVRVAREGYDVLLVTYNDHLGGMLSNGLGNLDTLYDGVRAPLLGEFEDGVRTHYLREYGEDSDQFRHLVDGPLGGALSFEPHVAEAVLSGLVADEASITVLKEHYPVSIVRANDEIEGIVFEPFADRSTRLRVDAAIFMDATYEGDLIATAGIPYRVGRESRDEFDEQHAGRLFTVKSRQASGDLGKDFTYLQDAVDGTLNLRPWQNVTQQIFSGSTGEGDDAVQAYNFRLCLSNAPDNRLPIDPPEGYDPERFTPMFEPVPDSDNPTLESELFIKDEEFSGLPGASRLPNDKCDWNTAKIPGAVDDYPEGDWETREDIAQAHRQQALGLLYFLQNDPCVPEDIQREANEWGLAADEFVDNGNLPRQLYVREARRLRGRDTFTENDARVAPHLERAPLKADSIGIAEWFMDSHDCRRERRRGSFYDGVFRLTECTRPSQISYRCILPQQVTNLLVPVCLSATHVGWGTVRLEPVWMQIGESAGFAAALALEDNTMPGELDVAKLRRTLVENGVMISFFNEFDMTCDKRWVAPIQYLGALGFFRSYDALPYDDLSPSTADAWATNLGDLIDNRLNPTERAARLPDNDSRITDSPVSIGEFVDRMEPELTRHGIAHDIDDTLAECGFDRDATATREQAACILYQIIVTEPEFEDARLV